MKGYEHNPWQDCPYCGGALGKHGCTNQCGGYVDAKAAERERQRQQERIARQQPVKDIGEPPWE